MENYYEDCNRTGKYRISVPAAVSPVLLFDNHALSLLMPKIFVFVAPQTRGLTRFFSTFKPPQSKVIVPAAMTVTSGLGKLVFWPVDKIITPEEKTNAENPSKSQTSDKIENEALQNLLQSIKAKKEAQKSSSLSPAEIYNKDAQNSGDTVVKKQEPINLSQPVKDNVTPVVNTQNTQNSERILFEKPQTLQKSNSLAVEKIIAAVPEPSTGADSITHDTATATEPRQHHSPSPTILTKQSKSDEQENRNKITAHQNEQDQTVQSESINPKEVTASATVTDLENSPNSKLTIDTQSDQHLHAEDALRNEQQQPATSHAERNQEAKLRPDQYHLTSGSGNNTPETDDEVTEEHKFDVKEDVYTKKETPAEFIELPTELMETEAPAELTDASSSSPSNQQPSQPWQNINPAEEQKTQKLFQQSSDKVSSQTASVETTDFPVGGDYDGLIGLQEGDHSGLVGPEEEDYDARAGAQEGDHSDLVGPQEKDYNGLASAQEEDYDGLVGPQQTLDWDSIISPTLDSVPGGYSKRSLLLLCRS